MTRRRPTKPPVIRVQHSLSEAQASELRTLIAAHVTAQVSDSWAGGGDPLDVPVVQAAAALAEAELGAFIARLVRDGK